MSIYQININYIITLQIKRTNSGTIGNNRILKSLNTVFLSIALKLIIYLWF